MLRQRHLCFMVGVLCNLLHSSVSFKTSLRQGSIGFRSIVFSGRMRGVASTSSHPLDCLVIAVDGPAGAGKGTAAKRIAEHYDFALLETGLLYRAAALKAIRSNVAPDDEEKIVGICSNITVEDLNDDELKSTGVAETASVFSAFPLVRATLLQLQHNFAATPPNNKAGAILDGRDIGTVVCPSAPIKFFIDAKAEVRAKRRLNEYIGKGLASTFEEVLKDIQKRDTRDRERTISPLKPATDAIILDTSDMSIEEVVKEMKKVIDAHFCKSKSTSETLA